MPSLRPRAHTAHLPVVAPPRLIDVPELGQWTKQWDVLVDAAPLPSPFLRSWWLTGTGGQGRHFVLVVDDGQLLGGLALEQHHRLSSIQLMGDASLCSDHIDLLAASGHEAAVGRLVGDWLGHPSGRFLDLRGVRAGSMLAEVLPGRVRREPLAAAPYALLPESAEAFRATLTSRFRRKIRNTTNRLEGDGVTYRKLRGPAVLSGLDTLRDLHRAQWQGRSDFLSSFDRFVAGCSGGIEADEVVVHQLATDDLVVATAFAFEVAGRASMYQSARLTDPRWKDVGVALFASIVDDACARGLTEVDFLRGEEEWKGRFTSERREMFRLVAGTGVLGGLGRAGTAATFHASQTAVRGVRFGRSVASRWNAKWQARSSTGGGGERPGTSESSDDS